MSHWTRPKPPPRERDDIAMRKTAEILATLDARIVSHGSENLHHWLKALNVSRCMNATDKACVLVRVMRHNFGDEVLARVREALP